ncbi:MAG: TRAP transporter TatT component family protein [Acidobacteriota bacterium]
METQVARLGGLALALAACGCMSWTPGWRLETTGARSGDAAPRRAEGDRLFLKADSRESLLAALEAYRGALVVDPADYATLARACEAATLLGAGYETGVAGKRRAYRKAIRLCEAAMATNPDFRARVVSGQPIGAAAAALTSREADAMFFWVTAVSYYFKECLWGPAHLLHFRWMLRARDVLAHLAEVAPETNHGGVDFTWAIYYLALPASAGGDMNASRAHFARAAQSAPDSLLVRWGRAKYFAVKTGERDLFVSDLDWVLAQDPRRAPSPYPWNVYFQRDARLLLSETDRRF